MHLNYLGLVAAFFLPDSESDLASENPWFITIKTQTNNKTTNLN